MGPEGRDLKGGTKRVGLEGEPIRRDLKGGTWRMKYEGLDQKGGI